jgi:P27 family predicted phage terminase small subunit
MRKLPTKIKERQGTLEKSRVLPDEVEYDSAPQKIEMPHWWPPDVQKIYQEYIAELRRVKLLFKTDLRVLQRFCFAIYQAQEAEAALVTEGFIVTKYNHKGETYDTTSDWVLILKNANSIIDKYSSKFGFSPVDKTRIALQVAEKKATQSLLK